MKKLLSIILSLCMLLSITAGLNLTAYAETYKGKCGKNVTWSLDTKTGELIIKGKGNMENFHFNDFAPPWYSYKSYIEYVTVNEGVTSIGNSAFRFCNKLKTVTISDSVKKIGE